MHPLDCEKVVCSTGTLRTVGTVEGGVGGLPGHTQVDGNIALT
jgi:hypothetical protein